jgi:chromate transporter
MLVEERRWMSAEEFNAQLGLCQFLPGPNVINLAVVVGKRYQGLRAPSSRRSVCWPGRW